MSGHPKEWGLRPPGGRLSDTLFGRLQVLASAAQVSPVSFCPEILTKDEATRLALDIYAKALAQRLIDRNGLTQIANGRFAALGKRCLFSRRQTVQIRKEFVHVGR